MWQQQPEIYVPNGNPEWLQASYYQNIPHGEINWAQLAQQWIAMRQVDEQQQHYQRQLQIVQQQQQQQNLNNHQAMMFQQQSQQRPMMDPFQQCVRSPMPVGPPSHMPPPMPQDNHRMSPQYFAPQRSPIFMRAPQMQERGPSAPIPLLQTPPRGPVLRPPPMPQQRFMQLPHRPEASMRPPRPRYIPSNSPPLPPHQYVPMDGPPRPVAPPMTSLLTSNFAPPPVTQQHREPVMRTWRPPLMNQQPQQQLPPPPQQTFIDETVPPEEPSIDSQMRKQLPAWIREGLEKMEREKKKEDESEQQHKDGIDGSVTRTQIPKWRLEELESEAKSVDGDGERDKSGDEDSCSEGGSEPGVKRDLGDETTNGKSLPGASDEIREQLLIKIRRWMTSILLEVTNTEVSNIVQNFYNTVRLPAQPKVLAQSSALASILGFSDDDEEDDEPQDADGRKPKSKQDGINDASKEARKSDDFKVPLVPTTDSTISKKKHGNASTGNAGHAATVGASDSAESTHSERLSNEEREKQKSRGSSTDSKEKNKEKHSSSRNHDNDSRSAKLSSRSSNDRHKRRSRSRSPSRNSRRRESTDKDSRSRNRRSRSPRESRRKRSRSRSPARRRR